jgi:ABC-type Na+ transport system ATPase subunit NatA
MGEVDLLCDRLAIIHKGEMKYKGEMKVFRENMSEKSLTGEFIKTVQA